MDCNEEKPGIMSSFYAETLGRLNLPRTANILAVCGGEFDRNVLLGCGYSVVTICNLDERMRGDEFEPFAWRSQDAEDLPFSSESFDYCIVHAGLHHCASPHRALLEMYRVARRGILVFEARDSMLMRAAVALRRVPSYEVGAVRDHSFKWGGLRNSCVPNFVYRWTEREVNKTLASYAPYAPHRIQFFYGLRIPQKRLPFYGSHTLGWISVLLESGVKIVARALPKQGNLFAFYVPKPGDDSLFPWLRSRTQFNEQYAGPKTLDF